MTLHSNFFEILKFVFLCEVAHIKKFCVKLSGLVSKLKILENWYLIPRIFNVQTYIWSLSKAKKFMVRQWNLPNYFASVTKNFAALLFFLAASDKKFQRENVQPYAYAANANASKARWTRGSQACTQLVDSLFCITCSLEKNAFSVLHYVIGVALHYSMLHRLEIFSAPGTIAPGNRLGKAARWQLRSYISFSSTYFSYGYTTHSRMSACIWDL